MNSDIYNRFLLSRHRHSSAPGSDVVYQLLYLICQDPILGHWRDFVPITDFDPDIRLSQHRFLH